jgi:hypothetical protein
MSSQSSKRIVKVLSAVIGLVVLAALVIGAKTLGAGNVNRARQIAVRLQAAAIANPNPVAGTSTTAKPATPSTDVTKPAGGTTTTGAPASSSTSTSAISAGTTSAAPAKASIQTAAVAKGPATTSTAIGGGKGTPVVPPVAVVMGAPRRQPTGAEIAQAISAVHSLLPFFTPTPAQIASSGDQVCTALDHGVPFSQVASQALDLVGAGSLSFMIPSSVPEIAIRTLVALYCPANVSKLP